MKPPRDVRGSPTAPWASLCCSTNSPKSPEQTLWLGRPRWWHLAPEPQDSRTLGTLLTEKGQPSAARVVPSCCHTVSTNRRSDSPVLFGHDSVTSCPLRACPSLRGCAAGAQDGAALPGTPQLGVCCWHHRKDGAAGAAPGPIIPVPARPALQVCLLSPLHGHWCRVCSKTSSQGLLQDPAAAGGGQAARRVAAGAAGAAAGAGHWQLCGSSSPGAASPSPVSPALRSH